MAEIAQKKVELDRYGENARVALTIFAAWNERDYDRALVVLDDDLEVVEVATGETFRGPQGLLSEYEKWAGALSDGWIDVMNVVESGEWVAMETVVRGTHDGDFPTPDGSIPPTGRQLEFEMCTVARIKDGKEILERHYFDVDSMMRQLGAE